MLDPMANNGCVMMIRVRKTNYKCIFLFCGVSSFFYNMYINVNALKGAGVEVLLIIALNGRSR